MKMLAINGSHRGRRGCTQRLLDKLAQGAGEAGGGWETVVLAEKQVEPCLACDACNRPSSLGRCVLADKDDVAGIFDLMRGADIVVYATPVYVFGVTGRMKTFMDRFNSTGEGDRLILTRSGLIFHPVDRQVLGKPIVILTLCANVEEETVRSNVAYFRTFARYLDVPVVGTLVRKMAPALEEEGNPRREAVFAAYEQAGRELASQGRIAPKTEARANRPLLSVPFFDLLVRFRFFKRKALAQARQDQAK